MMDRDDLLNSFTIEDIMNLIKELGGTYVGQDKDGYIFTTICHGKDSPKLYYYPNSKLFHCYTCCGTMSIYDLVMSVLDMTNFFEAFKYLCDFKGISIEGNKPRGFKVKVDESDFDFLNLHLTKYKPQKIVLPSYDENVLKIFDNYYPSCWEDEGISPKEMERFGVKFDFDNIKAIIPNRDIDGRLVGIRARSFNTIDLSYKRKYMPITVQGLTYRCPTGANLYGLYENQENIKALRKAIIFEGEKSVWHYGSMFGANNNIGVASLGTTFSNYQRKLLTDLEIDEVTVAYDKEFYYSKLEEGDKEHIKDYNSYIRKLIKLFKLFNPYCVFSIINCDNDIDIDYKDAPVDKGKDVFCKLYQNRIIIEDVEELEECLIK